MKSSCMVIGCSGLGVEVCKNIILAGISKLTIVDPIKPTSYDLGGNFYLHPRDTVGVAVAEPSSPGRAALCVDALSQLNPYVQVNVDTTITAIDLLSKDPTALCNVITERLPTIVTITIPLPEEAICTINELCRQSNICFIYSLTMSVFGQIFVDFGTAFIITYTDG